MQIGSYGVHPSASHRVVLAWPRVVVVVRTEVDVVVVRSAFGLVPSQLVSTTNAPTRADFSFLVMGVHRYTATSA